MKNPSANNRKELQKELTHARRGAAYYQKRVDALVKQLEKINVPTGGKGRADPTLPRTSMDFWTSLVASRPRSHQQIYEAAIKKLKLTDPTPEQQRKLKLRWSVALPTLVSTGKIAESGSGRERRFFLPNQG
jgi:hypothetical protein